MKGYGCFTYYLIWAVVMFSVVSTISCTECPDISQRLFREKVFCGMPSHPSYVCLFDENHKVFVEFCEKSPDFLAPGLKFVVRGGFDGASCHYSRFQPFKFWTNSGNECALLKSRCEGEGQITTDSGSTITDVSCRCDNSQGYAFVTMPFNQCFCNPSFEDCSCYKKDCSENHILSPDYNCIKKNSVQNQMLCSVYTTPSYHAVESKPANDRITGQEDIQSSARYPAIMILIVCVIFITDHAECISNNQKNSLLDKSISDNMKIVKDLLQNVLCDNVVIVVGQPKSGKSTIVHFVAMLLSTIYSYETINCKNADDIDVTKENGHNNKIFLLDNYFMYDSTDDDIIVKWRALYVKISSILSIDKLKILITCLPSHLKHYCNENNKCPISIFEIRKSECQLDLL